MKPIHMRRPIPESRSDVSAAASPGAGPAAAHSTFGAARP